MDTDGDLRCGLHGRKWCKECGDETLREVRERMEPRAPLPQQSDLDRQEFERRLKSLRLGRRVRR